MIARRITWKQGRKPRSKHPVAQELDRISDPMEPDFLNQCLEVARREPFINRFALQKAEEDIKDYRMGAGERKPANIKMSIVLMIAAARRKAGTMAEVMAERKVARRRIVSGA